MDEGGRPEGDVAAQRGVVRLESAVLLRVALDPAHLVQRAVVADVTSDRSVIPQPSLKTRRPIRAPTRRKIMLMNGVPAKAARYPAEGTFQYRSWRHIAGS